MEEEFKKFYIRKLVGEVNNQIKKEEEKEFFFYSIYVKAVRIVEKLVVKKLERMKENLTVHCYYRFCKKYENFLCDENGNCVCLIPLYREVLQIVRNIHFEKKKIL